MARPSAFNEEVAERILDGIADGRSLRTVCTADDMPSARTVHRWLSDGEGDEFDAFRQQYARARAVQADVLFDGIIETVQMVQSGRLDSKQGRTAIYGLEIVASRLAPKKFGRRLDLAGEVNTMVGVLGVPMGVDSFEEWKALDPPRKVADDRREIVPERAPDRDPPRGGMGAVKV